MLRVYSANTVIPGRCFICERAFEDGETATNTQFTYSPDWDSRLFGNKMICDNCVHDIAELNGYVAQPDHVAAITAVTDHNTELGREIDRLLQEDVDRKKQAPPTAAEIAAEVTKLMKPKPAPKPRSATV